MKQNVCPYIESQFHQNFIKFMKGLCKLHLKVLYVGLTLGIAVQIQNIGEGFFHPAPPPQT